MRILSFIEYSAIVVGIIAMIVGQFFGLRNGFHLGIFLVGAGIALGGLESVSSHQPAFFQSDASREAYVGTPAVIWGIMLLVIGATVIAAAYLLHDGLWQSTLSTLRRRPGPLLGGGGLIAACLGILLMLNPRGRRGAWWTLLVRIPKALLGLVLLLGGLAAIALGAWEWFDPRGYERIVRDMQAQLDPQAVVSWWKNLPLPWR